MQTKLALLALTGMLFLVGCTDPDNATRVLTQNGYKDIKLTGYEAMMCGQDDSFSTGFEATSPNGSHVKGAVCSSLTKGYTIRFK